MSLGATTPIEVAVSGPNLAANREFATRVRERLAQVPALRDVQFGQTLDYPTLEVNVNRERAGLMGIDMTDVSRSRFTLTSSVG
ncbi:AcrB/AcrD/AcrF family protein [compost metagenome]